MFFVPTLIPPDEMQSASISQKASKSEQDGTKSKNPSSPPKQSTTNTSPNRAFPYCRKHRTKIRLTILIESHTNE